MSAFRLRRKELDQLLTRDAPAEHRRTRGICPVCMENLLCDIQTDRANFCHGRLLSDGRFNTTILAHRCRRGVHPITHCGQTQTARKRVPSRSLGT